MYLREWTNLCLGIYYFTYVPELNYKLDFVLILTLDFNIHGKYKVNDRKMLYFNITIILNTTLRVLHGKKEKDSCAIMIEGIYL